MIEWFLALLGVFLIILGATHKTGFKDKSWSRWVDQGFWIFGFMLIASAVFLFNAPTPYGSLNATNTTMPQNITAAIYDDSGSYMGTIYFAIPASSTTYVYQTSVGPDIANLVFLLLGVLGCIYAILWALSWMKEVIEKKKPEGGV